MKNAMKKLMAFALVAVMLVGMLPFAASADTTDGKFGLRIVAQVEATKNNFFTTTINTTGGYTLQQYCDQWVTNDDGYELIAANFGGERTTDFSKVVPTDASVTAIGFYFAEIDDGKCKYCGVAEGEAHKNEGNCPEFECPGRNCGAKINAGEAHGSECPNYVCPTCGVKVNKGEAHIAPCADYVCPHCFTEGSASHRDTCPEYKCPDCGVLINQDEDHTSECDDYECTDCGSKINQGATHTTRCKFYVPPVKDEDKEEDKKPSEDDKDEEIVQKAVAYIYVGNNDFHARKIQSDYAFSIDGAVEEFDDWDTNYHYAFNYFTVDGSSKQYTNENAVVQVGQTVHIRVKVTESKLNHNKVYLQIFMNNDFDVPAKTINVTTMATDNGLYREGNVRDLILEYFSAKNSNGIKIDGMYPSTGSWVAKFLEDTKVKNVSNDEIIEMKEDDYVVFNIMVTNAKLKSSSTADSSNPKTADNIYAVVTIMTASAAALAVAFYLNKKRAF